MNTLLLSLLLSLPQTPDTAYVQPSFTVSAYVVQSTGQVRLAIDNHWQRRLYIRLVNTANEVLYEDWVRPKAHKPYRTLLNLDQLPQATYRLQISDGRQTVSRDVMVGAPVAEPVQPVRYVTLRTVQELR